MADADGRGLSFADVARAAEGRWPEILGALGIDTGLLRRKHGRCPAEGCSEDGFRFADDGRGAWFCSAHGDTRGGDGFELLAHVRGWGKAEQAREVSRVLGLEGREVSPEDRARWARERERSELEAARKRATRGALLVLERAAAILRQEAGDSVGVVPIPEERVLRRARALWGAGATEGASPYLERKGVPGLGVRYQVADHEMRAWIREDGRKVGPQRVPAGSVLVPMRQIGERLVGVQWIAPDGAKQFLAGVPTVGAVHLIPGSDDSVLIGEGYATVAAVAAVIGWRALVAFTSGGLEPAGLAARMRWPRARLAWLADWDGGPDGKAGVEAATRAAARCGGVVLVPPHVEGADSPKVDWADVALDLGPEGLREMLRASYRRGLAVASREDRAGPAARLLGQLGVLRAE